jgi:hypothetical protein
VDEKSASEQADPVPTTIRITVAIERGSTPLAGTVDVDGDQRPFSGWIELSNAIAAAHEAAAPETAPKRSLP